MIIIVRLFIASFILLNMANAWGQWYPESEVPPAAQQEIIEKLVREAGSIDVVQLERHMREWYMSHSNPAVNDKQVLAVLNSGMVLHSEQGSHAPSSTTIADYFSGNTGDPLLNCIHVSGYSDSQTLAEVLMLDCPWIASNPQITNISALVDFPNLREVSVPNHDVCNISPLTSLTQLEELNLSGNTRLGVPYGLCNLGQIANLNTLKYLFLDNLGLNTLPNLSSTANYLTLSFSGNKLSGQTHTCGTTTNPIDVYYLNLDGNQLKDANLALIERFDPTILNLSNNQFERVQRPVGCEHVFNNITSISLDNNQSSALNKTLADLSDLTLDYFSLSSSNFVNLPAKLPTVCMQLDLTNMAALKDWQTTGRADFAPERPYVFSLTGSDELFCSGSNAFRDFLSFGGNNAEKSNVCPDLLLGYQEHFGLSCDPDEPLNDSIELSVERNAATHSHILQWEELLLESEFRDFEYEIQKRIAGVIVIDNETYTFEGGRGRGIISGLPIDTAYEFRIRRCLNEIGGTVTCSRYSPWVGGSYPLTTPVGLNLSWIDPFAGTYKLRWSYPQNYWNTTKPDEFRVRLNNNVQQIYNLSLSSHQPYWESQTFTFTEGGVLRVDACSISTNPIECGPAATVTLTAQPELNQTISVPGSVILSDPGADSNQINVTILNNGLSNDQVDYYRLHEEGAISSIGGNQGPTHIRDYYMDVSQSRTAASHSLKLNRIPTGGYKISAQACRRNREGQDICSDSTAFSSQVQISNVLEGYDYINESLCKLDNSTADGYALQWEYDPPDVPGQDFLTPDHYLIEYDIFGLSQPIIFKVDATSGHMYVETVGTIISDPNGGVIPEFVEGRVFDNPFATFSIHACPSTSNNQINQCQFVGSLYSEIAPTCPVNFGPQSTRTQNGGPAALNPGVWVSDELPRQGFAFYWASDLRHSNIHEEYGETYDLYAYWTTYQYLRGVWTPVWLYAELKQSDNSEDRFEGALYYPQDSLDAATHIEAGFMAVDFNSSNNLFANVTLDVNLPGGLFSDGPQIYTIGELSTQAGIIPPGGQANPTDFNNGVWHYRTPNNSGYNHDYAVLSWQHNWFEGQVILGFDFESADPIWINGTIDCRSSTTPGNCSQINVNGLPNDNALLMFHAVTQGLPPFDTSSNANDVVSTQFEDGLRRRLPRDILDNDPLTLEISEQFRADLEDGAGNTYRRFGVDAHINPHLLNKEASFHDIRYQINGIDATQCSMQNNRCDVTLTWFSDDDFFDNGSASVAAYMSYNNGPYVAMNAASCGITNPPNEFVVKDYVCRLLQPGSYHFVLESRAGTSSARKIAEAPVLIVDNPVNPGPQDGQPAIPPAPAAKLDLSEDISSTKIGSTAGSFEVDQSGAATYQIPLITAPGSAGVVPQLSLQYSSQAGSGAVGVGWELSGMSGISRCGQTYVVDGVNTGVQLNQDDRLCLDGQRLIKINNTGAGIGADYWAAASEYRTEVDSITRVRSVGTQGNGPVSFLVWRNDGSVSQYGQSSDSRILAGTDSTTVYSWMQNRFSDSAGNYYDFSYWHPDGNTQSTSIEYYLDRVNYTGNTRAGTTPNAFIQFNYEDKLAGEVGEGYLAGAVLTSGKRLNNIESKVTHNSSEEYIRYYQLDYGTDGLARSRLNGIRECWNAYDATTLGFDSTSAPCLNATHFTWNDNAVVIDNQGAVDMETQFHDTAGTRLMLDPRFADMNGDGRQDLVYVIADGAGDNKIYVALAQPYTSNTQAVFANITPANGQHFYTGIALPDSVIAKGQSNAPDSSLWQVMDYDADGFQDVVFPQNGQWQGLSWDPSVAGSYSAQQELGAVRPDGNTSLMPSLVRATDIDGDGLTDLVYGFNNESLVININQWDEGTLGQGVATNQLFNQPQIAALPDVDLPECQPGSCVVAIHQYSFGGQTEIFDYDGDGAVDILLKERVLFEYGAGGLGASGYTFLSQQEFETQEQARITYKTNNLTPDSYVDVTLWRVLISNHQGGFDHGPVLGKTALCDAAAPSCAVPTIKGNQAYLVDLNGDALSDFVYHHCGSDVCADPNDSDDFWYYRINNGNGLSPATTFTAAQLPATANDVRFVDYRGDDLVDILWVPDGDNNNAIWNVLANGFNGFGSAASSPAGFHAGELNAGDTSLFADVTGDGKTDHLFFNRDSVGMLDFLWLQWGRSANDNSAQQYSYQPHNVITEIEDGLGARTLIDYKSLVQSSVYTRSTNAPALGIQQNAAVYDIVPAHYVVSSVASSAPNHVVDINLTTGVGSSLADLNGMSRVEYHYAGAKIQGNGRGFLGFEQIGSFNEEYRVLTISDYYQSFPFTGSPSRSRRYYLKPGHEPWSQGVNAASLTPCASGDCNTDAFNVPTVPNAPKANHCATAANGSANAVLLSDNCQQMATVVTLNDPANGLYLEHPYIASSHEKVYSPNIDANGLISGSTYISETVTTNSQYSVYGEVGQTIVEVFNTAGQSQSRITTVNEYLDNDVTDWHLSRLTKSTVAHVRANRATEVRVSSFDYDNITGLLRQETVEPDDAPYTLTTTYSFDLFGNRLSTQVQGTGVNRISSQRYDSRGRYVDQTTNALNQITSQVLAFDYFGNPLNIVDIQGVESQFKYDSLGREFQRYTPTGVTTHMWRIAGTGGHCPTGTAYHQSVTTTGQPSGIQCYDLLGRETRRAGVSFDGTWVYVDTHYDFASRVAEVSEPYYQGASPIYWTRTLYDELGRTLAVLAPNGGLNTTDYDGLVTTITNPLDQQRVETRNEMGELILVTDDLLGTIDYEYDAIGRLVTTDGPLPGAVDRSTMSYNVLGQKISMDDPDKGFWEYRYNVLGELVCQRDERLMGVSQSYDHLGRVVSRMDYSDMLTQQDFDNCSGVLRGITTWIFNNTAGSNGYGQLQRNIASHDGRDIAEDFVYDSFGRISSKTTTIDGQTSSAWVESTTYDQYGRVFQQFDATGYDYGIQSVYNSHGYLSQQIEARFTGDADANNDRVYYQINAMDARGNVVDATYGNGINTLYAYDTDDGQLDLMLSTNLYGDAVQDLDYDYDLIGNLVTRHDRSGGKDFKETFIYDALNRMTSSQLTVVMNGSSQTAGLESASYDAAGNLQSKAGQSYTYGYEAGCASTNAGPHAVCSKGGVTYQYDVTGNMVSDTSGRAMTYSVFHKPTQVSSQSGSNITQYWYGAGRNRFLRTDTEGITYYLGNVELTLKTDGSRIAKRYLGNFAIQDVDLDVGSEVLNYTHRDHIGSLDVVTDSPNGNVDSLYSFSAWGERREVSDWNQPVTNTFDLRSVTPRGFTGHEHIDHAGIIHMNGRIYDASLGRFLQADPMVQAPENSQNLNRYSYVLNNPLSYTDPSGYFFKGIGKFFKRFGRQFAAIAITAAAPYLGAGFVGTVFAGAAAGYVSTGSLKGALAGAFTAAAFYGVGEYFQSVQHQNGLSAANEAAVGPFSGLRQASAYLENAPLTSAQRLGKVIAHGIVGGIGQEIQGGQFGHGFISAGTTQAFSGFIEQIQGFGRFLDTSAQVFTAALIGGTISKLSGGRFANGAVTGAFSRAFNEATHQLRKQQAVDHTIGQHAFSDKQIRDFLKAVFPSPSDKLLIDRKLLLNQDQIDFALGLAAQIAKGQELGGMLGSDVQSVLTTIVPIGRGLRIGLRVGLQGTNSASELSSIGVDGVISSDELFNAITSPEQLVSFQNIIAASSYRAELEHVFGSN